MKYLLDFDRTLFDTDAFVAQVERDGRGGALLTPGIWDQYHVQDFLYADVLSWLKTVAREDVYIVTALAGGDEAAAFQRAKLASGGFNELVTDTHFVSGLKGEVVAEIAKQFPPEEPIVFVDDRIEQCLSVQACAPQVTVCLMVREPESIGEVSTVQRMPVVHDLSGVDAIITTV